MSRWALIIVAATLAAGCGGGESSSSSSAVPAPAKGRANLRVTVVAKPKNGAKPFQSYMPSEAAKAEAAASKGDFELVDYEHVQDIVVWVEPQNATTAGAATHKLKVTTKSGAVRTIYLDATTYLDRRHTGVLNLPGGRQFDVTIDFDNWREVNGVKFAFDINEERTGKEPVVSLVTYTEKIEANVPLDDAFFATPAGK